MTKDEQFEWLDRQPKEVRALVHDFGFARVFRLMEVEDRVEDVEAALRSPGG